MNYIITTPEEGLIIGMISGATLFAILYNVFVQNSKKYEAELSDDTNENSDIKTEASHTDLYTDTLVNIRDHIVFINSNNLNDSDENKDESSDSESENESSSEDDASSEEIIHCTLFTENEIYRLKLK